MDAIAQRLEERPEIIGSFQNDPKTLQRQFDHWVRIGQLEKAREIMGVFFILGFPQEMFEHKQKSFNGWLDKQGYAGPVKTCLTEIFSRTWCLWDPLNKDLKKAEPLDWTVKQEEFRRVGRVRLSSALAAVAAGVVVITKGSDLLPSKNFPRIEELY